MIFRIFTLSFIFLVVIGKGYSQGGHPPNNMDEKIEYLKDLMPTLEKIERFIGRAEYKDGYNPNGGWTFDAELGWILEDAIRYDGIYHSATFYHYEETGARKRVNFPEQSARIQSYGNSFTHCDQVNDGESWQEYLAAHLCEPIENFGVGGYSVYQAFLRMMKIQETHPSKYIILNIWDDDHFRNLDSWWSIRSSKWGFCSFTMPHLRVNVENNSIIEIPNMCQRPEDVYKLRDIEWLKEKFLDDPVLGLMLSLRKKDTLPDFSVTDAHTSFGLPSYQGDKAGSIEDLRMAHTKAAIFSTIKILDMLNEYVKSNDKELFIVLSYSFENLGKYLSGEEPFDSELLDYLESNDFQYIDLRQAHLEEFKTFNLSVKDYLFRYYIGHYAPSGNFFQAMAIRDKIIQWLEPKPLPYQKR